jgi:signal transduction histidine kinase/ActR/RegA family two-component response regulator
LKRWRIGLLETMLTASIVSTVGSFVIVVIMSPGDSGTWIARLIAVVSLVLLLLKVLSNLRFEVRSFVFVAAFFIVCAGAIWMSGWGPGAILGSTCVVLFTRLLLGRTVAYAIIAALLAEFLLIALVHHMGGMTIDFSPFVLTSLVNWLRVAAMITVLAGAMGWALLNAVRRLKASLLEVDETVTLVRQEVETADRTHAQRLEAERELHDAQKLSAVEQFAGGVAHYFNNALTVIHFAQEELRASHPQSGSVNETARTIVEIGAKTRTITGKLLAFSRRQESVPEKISLDRFIEKLEPTLSPLLPEDITLVTPFCPSVKIEADPLRLEQVLHNLVVNAWEAMPKGGTITVAARTVHTSDTRQIGTKQLPPGTYAQITVADEGSGIPEADRVRVFEPFFTTKSDRHQGLGLSVVFGVVRNAGGAVEVQSPPAHGALITIYWPALEDDANSPAFELPADSGASVRPSTAPSTAPHLVESVEKKTSLDHAADSESQPEQAADEQPIIDDGQDVRAATPNAVLEEWRRNALQTTLISVTVLMFIASVAVTILAPPRTLGTVLTPMWLTVLCCGLASRKKAWPFQVRVFLLTAALSCVFVVGMSELGYLSPGLIILAALLVLLSVLLTEMPGLIATLALIASVFVLCGIGFSLGILDAPGIDVDMSQPANWVRTGIVCAVGFTLVSIVMGITVTPLANKLTEQSNALGELRVIRQRRAAEAEARLEAERVLVQVERLESVGNLAGSIAHDINNALQGLVGWGEIIAMGRATDRDDFAQALEHIANAADDAAVLSKQLLVGGALQARAPRPVDLATVLWKTQRWLSTVLPSKITIELEIDERATVLIDPVELRQILLNLATNARDAMPGGGTLILRTRAANASELSSMPEPQMPEPQVPKRFVVVDVADTGVGMDQATMARIFERHFTTKKVGIGTGLGLATVTAILDRCQGRISVWSRPGRGSCFSLFLPVTSDAQASAGPAPSLPFLGKAETVLLAEDEPQLRQFMARRLRDAGYRVLEAEDGNEALAVAGKHREAIVILCTDAIMPGITLNKLIEAFHELCPNAKTLICSGHMPEQLAQRQIGSGGLDLLVKPFRGSELIHKIAELSSADGPSLNGSNSSVLNN